MKFFKRRAWVFIALAVLLFALLTIFVARTPFASGTPTPTQSASDAPAEQAVIVIPLAGPAANANAEFSGLAWAGDNLILLPQYPNRFGAGDGALLAIAKADLLAHLDGARTDAITPRAIPLHAPGLAQRVAGFEGYEALAFVDDQVFLTIEAKPGAMLGNLVKGKLAPDANRIEIDAATLTPIQPQAGISNFSDETIVVTKNKLLTLYEANGATVNPQPVAHVFDFKPAPLGTIPFPHVEYRLTDATPTDAADRFWAINYFFTGDTKILPLADPLAARFGKGKTHAQFSHVERLVEFQFSAAGITLTETPPLQLVLPNGDARNWEGIARLDKRGFLIVTDAFPKTILGFVPQ